MTEGRIRLGAEIQRRRKQLGLTQEDLAQRMDVSRQSVTKWETGQSAPDLDRLVQLREVLNVSLDELLKGPSESAVAYEKEPAEAPGAGSPADSAEPDTPHPPNPPAVPVDAPPLFARALRLTGGLLLFAGLSALLTLWIMSILSPVRLTDWNGSLYSGLEGYIMAHDYQPLLHAALGGACGGALCLLATSSRVYRLAAKILPRLRKQRAARVVRPAPSNYDP